MDYASTNLGVQHASEFESPLGHKGFGPDILSQIPDASLTALGLSEGDALHLKNGSQKWWNGPNAKRKLSRNQKGKMFGISAQTHSVTMSISSQRVEVNNIMDHQ